MIREIFTRTGDWNSDTKVYDTLPVMTCDPSEVLSVILSTVSLPRKGVRDRRGKGIGRMLGGLGRYGNEEDIKGAMGGCLGHTDGTLSIISFNILL